MRVIGTRKSRSITLHADTEAFIEGARFNDDLARLSVIKHTCFPKGVYRYRSHEEADQHWLSAIVQHIVLTKQARQKANCD